jgi:hypothetical protein
VNLNLLPCISDADPGADDMDDDTYALLEEIQDAIRHLQNAEDLLLRGEPDDADRVDEYIMDAVTALGFPALPAPSSK